LVSFVFAPEFIIVDSEYTGDIRVLVSDPGPSTCAIGHYKRKERGRLRDLAAENRDTYNVERSGKSHGEQFPEETLSLHDILQELVVSSY
jgi:hypothetical protein